MSFRLSARSRARMRGVHPALVAVVEDAVARTPVDFITEGLRTASRQTALVQAGASRTLKSRHLTGHAVDVAALVEGRVRWDWPLYARIAEAFKAAAMARGVPIVWGGDCPTLRDGPHFELDRKAVPMTVWWKALTPLAGSRRSQQRRLWSPSFRAVWASAGTRWTWDRRRLEQARGRAAVAEAEALARRLEAEGTQAQLRRGRTCQSHQDRRRRRVGRGGRTGQERRGCEHSS
jgi:peptidoglycan LD-endopeptidase CwlK